MAEGTPENGALNFNVQILNEKLNKRIDELITILNQPKEDIQAQITSVKLDTQPGGPETNLLVTDLKEKKVCLRIGGLLEEAERGINSKDSIIIDMIEWMSNELDIFRKMDGVCRIDLLYATKRQLLRDTEFQFVRQSTKQQVMRRYS